MPAHYDDPKFSYVNYWQGRDYENQSELIALKKILHGKAFDTAADIGGGYGRLSAFLTSYAKKVYLIEPSVKQLSIAKEQLHNYLNIEFIQGTSQPLKLTNSSLDLVIMIRVSHHLPDLEPTLLELNRVLKPKGLLIFEVANSVNFKSRLKSWFTGTHIHAIPIEKRSLGNIRKKTIPFVNHHPDTVKKLLISHGFIVQSQLSVSNFRSPFLKKILPINLIVGLEKRVQTILGKVYFGPSIFLVCIKK